MLQNTQMPRRAGTMEVHEDRMISRLAYMLEYYQNRIMMLRRLIALYEPSTDPSAVSMEQLQNQLLCEQSALDTLLTEMLDGRLETEAARIREKYLKAGEKEGDGSVKA